MLNTVQMPIIGYIRSPFRQKFGIPRQPNLVNVPATIELIPPFSDPNAFVGIEQFSHLWLLWQFHQNKPQDNFRPQIRPPRLGGNDKIGVFASRSMYRPANIGLSVVQLVKMENRNNQAILHILGVDMVDNTPIFDIKPYIAYSDSIPHANSGFAIDKPTLKTVTIAKKAQQQLDNLINHYHLSENDVETIQQLIAQDPRPAYRQTEIGIECFMQYHMVDVGFLMTDNQVLMINSVKLIENPNEKI